MLLSSLIWPAHTTTAYLCSFNNPLRRIYIFAPLNSIELFQENQKRKLSLQRFRINVLTMLSISLDRLPWMLDGFITSRSWQLFIVSNVMSRDFQRGRTERTVRESYVGQSILMIRFKVGENPGTEPTTFELELRSIVKRLKAKKV